MLCSEHKEDQQETKTCYKNTFITEENVTLVGKITKLEVIAKKHHSCGKKNRNSKSLVTLGRTKQERQRKVSHMSWRMSCTRETNRLVVSEAEGSLGRGTKWTALEKMVNYVEYSSIIFRWRETSNKIHPYVRPGAVRYGQGTEDANWSMLSDDGAEALISPNGITWYSQ